MIYILLKGLFIGLLSSAPMGPVGMLCVQRTLNDGRPHGIVTGLGAAVGDSLYALVTVIGALGLSFIVDYIELYKTPVQIVGSIILIAFGYFVYRQNPSKNLTKFTNSELPVGKIFASSLGLTLLNVGMPFLYILFFARFDIIDTDNVLNSLLIIPAVALGAIVWWLFITYIVDKLRNKFNPRGLKVFNRIIGVVFIIIGVVGAVTGAYMEISGDAQVLDFI